MFEALNGRLPTNEEGLQALLVNPDPANLHKWSKLIDTLPKDPWGREYQYFTRSSDGKLSYGIYSFGKDGISHSNGNDPDDFNSWEKLRQETSHTPLILIFSASATALVFVLSWQAARRRQQRHS